MNVGIAVHSYDRSEGTGGYVTELLPSIAGIHEVTLYAARIRAPVPSGVTVVRVPAIMARTYTAILSFPTAFKAVRRKHDLTHAQGWVTSSADIVTAHIVMAGWRDAAGKAGVRSRPGERYLGGFVERREANLFRDGAKHLIAPSQKAKQEIARYYGRTDSVSVVPHGFPIPVELPSADSARKSLNLPSTTTALFVGDIRKGLAVAIKAVAAVPGVQLAIVSRSAPTAPLGLARSLGVANRVHWLGELKDPMLAYAASDLLLHPTIYDSFGLVVAEAMAFGVAPVTTVHAGISELITHGESGWIVDGDVVSGTTKALAALTSDRLLRDRMGKAAKEVATSRSWDTVANETLTIYEQVAGR
ncbi:glycosyltransferase family 4 protein [Gemmatimonadota bacterium]